MRGPDRRRVTHPLTPSEVIIDGTAYRDYLKQKYRVRIDGNDIDLPFRIFRVFALLALRRDLDSGWVDRKILSWSETLAKRYISATRMTLRAANWSRKGGVDGAWMVIEANLDRVHHYRLIAEPELIRVNPELVHFDDSVIAREAESFVRRAAERLICPDAGEKEIEK